MKLHEMVNNRDFNISEYKVYFGVWNDGGELLWRSRDDGKITSDDTISQYSISYITVDVATGEIVIEVL